MSDLYRFESFTLDPQRRLLASKGLPVLVTAKAFDILLYFLQHPNRIVSKQELMKAIWPDTIVEEGNLTQTLSVLRKLLAEHGAGSGLIVTVGRQGYQFTANVTRVGPPAGPGRQPPWRSLALGSGAALMLLITVTIAWQRFRAGPSGTEMVRLAVLPFVNLTGDSAQDYLADGLTEETITQLARLRPEQLEVIARTSVMQYKHDQRRLDEIGRELGVQYALESSLRRSADRLRVTAQLVRVRDQSHLWANDFDYAPEDMLRIEDSVAGAVAREVQLRLTPAQRARLARVPTTNAIAVDAVMRGRDLLLLQNGKVTWTAAKRYFNEAIALDSGYALAWTWLTATYRFGVDQGYVPPNSALRTARFAISRALMADSSLPEAWVQLGQLQRLVDWDWEGARTSYQRALDLDQGSAETLSHLASIKSTLGRLNEAVALQQRAVALDPLDRNALLLLGVDYYYIGRLTEAAKTLETIPPYLRGRFTAVYQVQTDLAQGHIADAAAAVEEVPDSSFQLFERELVLTQQRDRHAADSALATYIDRYRSNASYQVAKMYAFRGEADSALAWLDRAYAARDQGLTEVKVDPLFANVRHDPRYAAFLTKMRLPP